MKAFGTKTAVFTAAALLLGTSAYAANEKSGKLDKKLQAATQKLHASNQAEVEAGQLASRTAQSAEVKQYAQRMVDDHQKNDDQLKELARTLNVNLEGEEFTKQQKKAQKDLEKVQGKSGAEFDKAYMKMMVSEHERDVKDVEKAAKDARKGNHTELATFLDTTHSHLNMHLEEARRIERTAGSGVASGAGSTTSGTAPSATQSDTATGTDRAATTGGTKGAETGTSTPEAGAGTGGSTTGRIGSTDTTTGGTGSGAAGSTTEGDRAATTGGTSGAETGTTGGSGRTSSTTGTGTDTSTSGTGAAGTTPEGDRAATTGGTSGAETGTSSPQGAGTGGSTTSGGSGTTR
jgi:putative membrane protein